LVNSLSRARSAQGSRTVGQRGHLQPKGSVAGELLGSAASRLHQSLLPSSGTAFHGKAGECLTARCYPCPGGTARAEMILLTENQRARAAFLILTSGGPAIRTMSAKGWQEGFRGRHPEVARGSAGIWARRDRQPRCPTAVSSRDRRFADSPLEGAGFEPSVPGAREPVILRKVNCAGIDRTAKKFGGVPMVRIHLPPAESLLRHLGC
jgi:hypothetical protein